MRIVIVTGLSGAGKTATIKAFEDIDFFCIDNMLPDLIPNFIDSINEMKSNVENVAFGIDVRGRDKFEHLLQIIDKTQNDKIKYEIVFLECNDAELLRRYKENRRQHPLSHSGRIEDGIKIEREKLKDLKERADYVIDTSDDSAKKLKEKIVGIYTKEGSSSLIVNIVSFGFKYGVPNDADFMFDVRFIPNPFYVDELKGKTGNDYEVYNYVMSYPETKKFIGDISNTFLNILPLFEKEGRNQIVIAIGCTGGQHRSVTVARELADILLKEKYKVILEHRELG